MKTRETYYFLYRMLKETIDGIEQNPLFKTVIFFNSSGEVSADEFRKIGPEFVTDKGIIFNTKEEMMTFLETAMAQFHAPNLFILSAHDYNIGIESCQDLSTFRELFQRYGNEIISEEEVSGSKKFLSKFF
jgi:hypothetical protein